MTNDRCRRGKYPVPTEGSPERTAWTVGSMVMRNVLPRQCVQTGLRSWMRRCQSTKRRGEKGEKGCLKRGKLELKSAACIRKVWYRTPYVLVRVARRPLPDCGWVGWCRGLARYLYPVCTEDSNRNSKVRMLRAQVVQGSRYPSIGVVFGAKPSTCWLGELRRIREDPGRR
jgi:hypothetical protein